ncbi:MAG TPA: cbb3-type cytochrome c oxidase subunit 3 [Usitatibacter sp.]|jgi:cbb3-type cytochrome oxidase subunit 3|nr:cbb3-type cytochrome c oxidase subunit 3 [Usitatibacter sp.]
MDMNLLREVVTVVSFLTFIGILRYALHPANKARFEEAAGQVLADDDATLAPVLSQGGNRSGTAPGDEGEGR